MFDCLQYNLIHIIYLRMTIMVSYQTCFAWISYATWSEACRYGFLTMLYLSVIIGIYQVTRVFVVEGLNSARFLHLTVLQEKYG